MTNLFQTLEGTAARGAEGLTPEARESVATALHALQGPDGGFAGLDGKSDPYYTLFAWLGLRALGAACERDRLCAYMAAHRHAANTVNAQCATLVLTCEGRQPPVSWFKLGSVLLRGGTQGVYAAFLLALALGDVPRWLACLAWRRQKRLFEAGAVERLPTPRLAAGLILASLAGECGTGILSVLTSRQCEKGGFASAPKALPDLLATAVARFSISNQQAANGGEREADLAFIEACWQDDGLFGASPRAEHGDAEHTFYGLLALGTCR